MLHSFAQIQAERKHVFVFPLCLECAKIPARPLFGTIPPSLLLLSSIPPFPSPSIISPHPSLIIQSTPCPDPARAAQLQLWPAVRRLRQRLSVTPTGSHRCLEVVLACEWRVQSARRGGETLTPWLLPELALSRAEVAAEGASSSRPLPSSPGHHRHCCNGCH